VGFPAKRAGETQVSPWGASHPARTPHSPGSTLTLPCSPVPLCQDPSPARGPSPLSLLHSPAPGVGWGNQSRSPILPKIITDTKAGSWVVPRLRGADGAVHPANASHMPLFAKLQDFLTGTVRWCFGLVQIFSLYCPMTQRGGGSGENPSQQQFQPPERHKTFERNNLLLLKP